MAHRVIGAMSIVVLAVALARISALTFPWRHYDRLPTRHRSSDDVFLRIRGIDQPRAEPADVAALPDSAEVIGISLNGCDRAYDAHAMSAPWTHVINDVIDGVPVTVTFCDRTRCVRVFTLGNRSQRPLDVNVAGWRDGQMWLQVDGRYAPHDSREIPYRDVPCKTVAWKDWKAAHPQTDVVWRLTARDRVGSETPLGQPSAADHAGD